MSGDILISKYNEAYIKIDADEGILMEISDAFTFEIKSAKYHPAYKMGNWDGKIRLFDLGKHTLYSGLYTEVLEFCKQRDYTSEVVTNQYGTPGELSNITRHDVETFIKNLNVCSKGEPVAIRDYQVEGVYRALLERSGIIKAATGAGKSLILYAFTRYMLDELNMRVLIVVPTVSLTTQLFNDYKDYSSGNGWSTDDNVHLISAGITKDTRKPVVISTFQSLQKQDADWINSFDCIFTDEGHQVTAATIKGIYEKGTKVKYRLACTGTLHDAKTHILVMKGLTGNVHDVASTKKLIENKQLVDLKITAIQIKYDKDVCKAMSGKDYDTEIKYIVTNSRRNKFIVNLASKCKGTTLVLFRYVDLQGEDLFKIASEVITERPVYYIDGGVKSGRREEIRQLANSDDGVIFASYGVFSTGVNLPAIENIIFASPLKSKITNLQSIGRGLRLKGDKTHCNLFDLGDDMSKGSKINYTMRHFGERLKMYTQEGFQFKFVNVDM